nr:alpha/beta family hydrolase [Auraticoccus cholistanensis]
MAVTTGQGPGRWFLDLPPATAPVALVLLGHGAGGGVDARDLHGLARWLPARGIAVARFEQPWRTAGRRVADRPPRLDEAWLEAVPPLRAEVGEVPLVVGGRSAGARVACRTATVTGAAAVLCLSFPLHLPGRDTSRLPELLAPAVPRVVLQGSRDPFGGTEELRGAVTAGGAELVGEGAADPLAGDVVQVRDVPDAGHDLRPAARAGVDAAAWRQLVEEAALAAVAAALGRPPAA